MLQVDRQTDTHEVSKSYANYMVSRNRLNKLNTSITTQITTIV